jgi:hypothetical protein
MEISPVKQCDFERSPVQLLRGRQSAESAAENDDSVFFPHSFSPERNLIESSIISLIADCAVLMRGICPAMQVLSLAVLARA